MHWIIGLLFLALFNGGLAIAKSEKTKMLDPRCAEMTASDDFEEVKKAMEISASIYNREGRLVCTRDGSEVPELTANDNWRHWITLIQNVTDGGLAGCRQFPQYYSYAYTAFNNIHLRRDCAFITNFCGKCELGCPHVHPLAYSSREQMISWATDTNGHKDRDSQCQRNWIVDHINKGLRRNETWLTEVRESCQSCYERDCTTIRAQFVNNLLMDELQKHNTDAQAVWNHLCRYPAALGLFDYTAFNLEERFNAYDEFLQLMLAFQSNSWWCFPVIIIFMIVCTAFFNIPNRYRDFFDMSANIESFKRFKADRLLQWAIKRLSTKVERMKAKAANAIQRLKAAVTKKKPTAPTAKTSAADTVSTDPKTKSSAIPDSKKKENGETIATGPGPVGGQLVEQGGLVRV